MMMTVTAYQDKNDQKDSETSFIYFTFSHSLANSLIIMCRVMS